MYFVLYSLSQCPNILLSTAKLSFNLLSRDPNSNKTTIVPQNKLLLLPSISQFDLFLGHREAGAGASPREEWHGHSLHTARVQMVAPTALFLPCHGSFSCTTISALPGLTKGQQNIAASPGASLGRCSCAPSPWQNEAGHNHSPAVAESRSVIVSPEGPTVPRQKSAGYKNVLCLNRNCLMSSRNRIKRGGAQIFLWFLFLLFKKLFAFCYFYFKYYLLFAINFYYYYSPALGESSADCLNSNNSTSCCKQQPRLFKLW